VALTRRGQAFGPQAEPYMAREYSEDTQKYVDDEIARIVDARYEAVLAKLRSGRALLQSIAAKLLELETLDQREFEGLLEPGAPADEAEVSTASSA
jgi:cell division protease FtsH